MALPYPVSSNRGQLGRGAAALLSAGCAAGDDTPGNGAAAYYAGDAYARPGQCGVILRGEPTVIAETGAQRMFRAGEGIVELVGTRHYGENRGDGELELVMFYAGTQGMSLSERADL